MKRHLRFTSSSIPSVDIPVNNSRQDETFDVRLAACGRGADLLSDDINNSRAVASCMGVKKSFCPQALGTGGQLTF